MLEQGWGLNFGFPTLHFTSVYENPCPVYPHFYWGRCYTTPVNDKGRGARTRLGSCSKTVVLLEEFDEKRKKETTICGLSGRRYHAHVAKMCANVFFAFFIHSSRETITVGHLGSRKSSNDVRRPIRAAPSRAPYFALERTSKVTVSRGERR